MDTTSTGRPDGKTARRGHIDAIKRLLREAKAQLTGLSTATVTEQNEGALNLLDIAERMRVESACAMELDRQYLDRQQRENSDTVEMRGMV
jgi:cell division FtsZ-interacting protein ZapD